MSRLAHFGARPAEPPRLPDGFDVPFEEAIAWARERGAVLPAEFYGARLQAVRARSFSIAGLAALDQLQQVMDSLAEATAGGQTLREWQKSLPEEVFSLGRARRELILRNAVQTHYGIGRTIQQRAHAAARPYLMWDAINDSRTRPAHSAMDGHIAPVGAPIWKRWSPPAGHNCRCTRISLTEAQARARGYPKADPGVEPDKGWEGDPTEGNEDLVGVIKERQQSCLTTFAAKKARARGLWCDERGLSQRVEVLRVAVANAQITDDLMRRSLGPALFDSASVAVLARVLPPTVAAAGLTLAEKVAIHVWTLDTSGEPWFARINALMRMQDIAPDEFEAVMPVAHALMSALRKLPPFSGVVHRGLKQSQVPGSFDAFVDAHSTGAQVYHPGFIGASQTPTQRLRGRVELIIDSATGRDISHFSVKPEQREVLFYPPVWLTVVSREVLSSGVVKIWATESKRTG